MASTEKTRRNRCAYRPCFSQTDKSTSSFSFPKDPQRAAVWIEACNRDDLRNRNLYLLHKNYCLCDKHFEEKYISSSATRKRLFEQAFPTKFLYMPTPHEETQINVTVAIPTPACVQGSIDSLEVPIKIETVPLTSTTSSQSVAGSSKNQAETSMDILSVPSTSMTSSLRIAGLSENPVEVSMETLSVPSTSMTFCVAGPSEQSEEIGVTVPSPLCSTPTGTQTPYTLSSETPRKQQLRKKLRALRKRIIMPQPKNEWTISDFNQMCDKCLSPSLAAIIKLTICTYLCRYILHCASKLGQYETNVSLRNMC